MSTVYFVTRLNAVQLRRVAINVNAVTMTNAAEAIKCGVLVKGSQSNLPQFGIEIRREARRINRNATVRREARRRTAGTLSVRKTRRVAKRKYRLGAKSRRTPS